MPVTVNINGLSAAHQGSNGIAMATVPDVCKTPSAAGPIPIPYPNIAMSSDLVSGTSTITIDGSPAAIQGSKFVKSTGDEAGAAGGVVSGVFAMEATFISFSPTVMLDGKPACRLTDKMLMNKGNTVCMGGLTQAPVAPAMSPADEPIESINPEAPKHCVLRSVIVSCGHSKRNLQIDLSRHDVQVLQIISKADEPDKLSVEWDGECGDHHPYCPSVGVKTLHGGWKPIDKATASIVIPAPTMLLVKDWFWILRVFLSQKTVTHDYYTLDSRICMGHDTADVGTGQWLQVQVFPEVEWKADMTLGYSHENMKNSAGKKEPFKYDQQATWTIGGAVDATYGKTKFKYSLEAEQHADALPVFGSLLKLIGQSAMVFDSMATFGAGVKLTPRWPKWVLSGAGIKLIELPGKPLVGSEGSFKFGFEPLFGITLEVSILDWLLRFAGGLAGPPGLAVAKALIMLRERFAAGVGDGSTKAQASLDIDILLTVGGQLDGFFACKFADGKSKLDKDCGITGSVDVKIEGHVIGKARVWRFEASGAGKVGAGSADGKEPSKFSAGLKPKGGKDVLAFKGEIAFNGLAFYYMLYIEIGVAGAESKKHEEFDEDPKFTSKPSASDKLLEKSGTCVLMKPWTWPGGGEEE